MSEPLLDDMNQLMVLLDQARNLAYSIAEQEPRLSTANIGNIDAVISGIESAIDEAEHAEGNLNAWRK